MAVKQKTIGKNIDGISPLEYLSHSRASVCVKRINLDRVCGLGIIPQSWQDWQAGKERSSLVTALYAVIDSCMRTLRAALP